MRTLYVRPLTDKNIERIQKWNLKRYDERDHDLDMAWRIKAIDFYQLWTENDEIEFYGNLSEGAAKILEKQGTKIIYEDFPENIEIIMN